MKKLLFLGLVLFSQLFAWELPQNVIYIHPKPDAVDISFKTGIIVRVDTTFQDQLNIDDFSFTVTGSESGVQNGVNVLSDNNILFQLKDEYEPGELVTVEIQNSTLGWTEPYTYQFSINEIKKYTYFYDEIPVDDPTTPYPLSKTTKSEMTIINGVSVPSDFPILNTEILKDGASDAKLFIADSWSDPPFYIMIFKPDGTPYFYKKVKYYSRDFTIQENGELSRFVYDDDGMGAFVIMDSSAITTRKVKAGNGYLTDDHEFVMLPDGHSFVFATGNRYVDMSEIVSGGDTKALLKDYNIQELDENGNVIFEWLCFEHYDVTDGGSGGLGGSRLDWIHSNSIGIDFDGNIISSNRNFDDIVKINRQTGEVIWRLGGKHNQFEFVNDEFQTSHQHDVRPVKGKPNHYTILDNGVNHSPSFSRAVEFELDTENMTATKVWEYRLPDGTTPWMGDVQPLANGNYHINWGDGSTPKATEVTLDGEVVYQSNFEKSIHVYRDSRFEWEHVVEKPYLIIEPSQFTINLIFNKFGDETVKEYKVFASKKGQNDFSEIATTPNTYFNATLNELENKSSYDFYVKAIHLNGQESVESNIESADVEFIDFNENFVINGDFAKRYNDWDWFVADGANCSRRIDSEKQFKFYIKSNGGGTKPSDIQLSQPDMVLLNDVAYSFEFDAYADANRSFEAQLIKATPPFTNYGKIGLTPLTTRKTRFEYEFIMQDPTDTNVKLVFNAGGNESSVYLDNVSVKMIRTLAVEESGPNPTDFVLHQNYPNPFNPITTIEFNVPQNAYVEIKVYNVLGKHVETLVNKNYSPGSFKVEFDGSSYSSGLYFYEMNARLESGEKVRKLAKMTILK